MIRRPLIICDCDEVLLHMVAPFRDWLAEGEGVEFKVGSNNFAEAMRWQSSGEVVAQEDMWRLLRAFFDTEMHRQPAIEGAVEGIARLQARADVVILTNLVDDHRDLRAHQLRAHGIEVPVHTNQGPKGPAIAALVEQYRPLHTFFIDDLPQHHRSARESVRDITTLHLCGEPELAPHIDCAHQSGHADARIDSWAEALPWLMTRLDEIEERYRL